MVIVVRILLLVRYQRHPAHSARLRPNAPPGQPRMPCSMYTVYVPQSFLISCLLDFSLQSFNFVNPTIAYKLDHASDQYSAAALVRGHYQAGIFYPQPWTVAYGALGATRYAAPEAAAPRKGPKKITCASGETSYWIL